jgi:hypothetical protein
MKNPLFLSITKERMEPIRGLRQAPTLRASRPIKDQPDAERADKAAGIAAHALSAACTVPAVKAVLFRPAVGTARRLLPGASV